MKRIKKAVLLRLDVQGEKRTKTHLVGVQKIAVRANFHRCDELLKVLKN